MFNRPLLVRTEREHRICRILHLTLLLLLVILSIALVSLKSMTVAFIAENAERGFTFDAGIRKGVKTEPFVLAALPRNLYDAPAKLAIVAGVVAVAVGVTHGALLIWDARKSQQVRRPLLEILNNHLSSSIPASFSTYYSHPDDTDHW